MAGTVPVSLWDHLRTEYIVYFTYSREFGKEELVYKGVREGTDLSVIMRNLKNTHRSVQIFRVRKRLVLNLQTEWEETDERP